MILKMVIITSGSSRARSSAVERQPFKLCVDGSIPSGLTINQVKNPILIIRCGDNEK